MTTDWENLPDAVTTYLTAHKAHDVDTALSVFTADAVVTDEGNDHRGTDAIRAWMNSAGGEYTYTNEFVGVVAELDVLQRLEGDFPGGVADLHYRFTVAGPSIQRLVIEP